MYILHLLYGSIWYFYEYHHFHHSNTRTPHPDPSILPWRPFHTFRPASRSVRKIHTSAWWRWFTKKYVGPKGFRYLKSRYCTLQSCFRGDSLTYALLVILDSNYHIQLSDILYASLCSCLSSRLKGPADKGTVERKHALSCFSQQKRALPSSKVASRNTTPKN